MRASLYVVGFAAAAVLGAGLIGFGCSSSSPSPGPVASDAGGDGGGSGEDAACTSLGPNVTTLDAGPLWACTLAVCDTPDADVIGTCAGECSCNNGILQSLNCINVDAGSVTDCFKQYLDPLANDPTVVIIDPLSLCLYKAGAACVPGFDAGLGDAATAPSDGGDAGTVIASDGGDASTIITSDGGDAGTPSDAAVAADGGDAATPAP